MQVSVTSRSNLERELKVGIPAERVEKEVAERLEKAAKTVRIKGFRKGKVPLKVVRQQYGKGVRQEVVGELVNKTFFEAVAKENLQPVGQPTMASVDDAE